MALERKDVRAKLDDDVHAAFKAICEHRDVDMGVRVEELIKAEIVKVQREVHDAMLLAAKLERTGIAGSVRAVSGTSGNHGK